MREAGSFVGYLVTIIILCKLSALIRFGCRAGCEAPACEIGALVRDGGRRRPALRQEDEQLRGRRGSAVDADRSARRDVGIAPYRVRCGFADDCAHWWLDLRGAPGSSPPTRGAARIRRGTACIRDESAGTSRTPSPTKHHPKRSVGRGPVPRRCPGAKPGGPRVAALRWGRIVKDIRHA